jgi:uncharacterized protein YciI
VAGSWTVVHNRPGPRWVAGKGPREQPLWDEHAAFIDALAERGHLALGGPYEDWSGSLLVFTLPVSETRATMQNDPWVVEGVLAEPEARPWLVWVDPHGLQAP